MMACRGALAVVLGLSAAAAGASTLLVEAGGLAEGEVARVAVFSSRVSFPEQPRFSEVGAADADGARWRFDDLPAGDYAVLVWQDRNDNGRLDRSMFGAAQEPYGLSNDVRDKRPDWDAVRVTLGPEPLTVRVLVE